MATRLNASRQNLYEVLGVAPESDNDAIRRAYVERIKEVHPDVNPAREEEAKGVNHAYEVLSDPVRRADHDRALFGIPCPFCGRLLDSEAYAEPHVGRHLREPVPRRTRRRGRGPGRVMGVLIVLGAALWMTALGWTRDMEPRSETAIGPLHRSPRGVGGAPSILSGAPSILSGAPSIEPAVPHAVCDPGELSRALNDGVDADRAVVDALNDFARTGTVAPATLGTRLYQTESRLDAARADALLPTPFAIEAGRLMEWLLGHDADAVAAAGRGDVVAYNAATREAYEAHRKYAAHVLGRGPGDLCV